MGVFQRYRPRWSRQRIGNRRAENLGSGIRARFGRAAGRPQPFGPLGLVTIAAGGIGAGLAAMFFLDPASGRRRRHVARDRLIAGWHRTRVGLGKSRRDLAHRAKGVAARTRSSLRPEHVDDEVLHERVRAHMGRAVSHPHAIETEVSQGRVSLRGPVLTSEAGRLLCTVGDVPGVRGVDDHLERHDQAEAIPGLQGERHRTGARFELLQESWSPGTRLVVGAAAGAAALRAFTHRRVGLGLLGLGVVARALSNLPLRGLLSGRDAGPGIDFQKTIQVNAPVEEVYAFFSDVRNYPRFMSHVREIQVAEDGLRSHWVVEGPAGIPVEWDAEVTSREPNAILAFRSRPGSRVDHTGIAYFEKISDGATRIHVRLTYHPPAGALGHVVASLFRKDPKHALDDDLLRFKSLLEQGKATGQHGQVSLEELREERSEPPEGGPELH